MHCAKVEMEHKEELKDSLANLHSHENQYEVDLERSLEEAGLHCLEASLLLKARDNLQE